MFVTAYGSDREIEEYYKITLADDLSDNWIYEFMITASFEKVFHGDGLEVGWVQAFFSAFGIKHELEWKQVGFDDLPDSFFIYDYDNDIIIDLYCRKEDDPNYKTTEIV